MPIAFNIQNTFETEMPYVALQEYSQRQEYFILMKKMRICWWRQEDGNFDAIKE